LKMIIVLAAFSNFLVQISTELIANEH